jgi:hypothetical protein
MAYENWPLSAALLDAFSDEIGDQDGTVIDRFHDEGGGRVYARATLPRLGDVAAGDRLQSGIALRGATGEVRVHPYTFRLVCSNGAIHAQAVQTLSISSDDVQGDEVIEELRHAIRACADPAAFETSLRQMRSARESEADVVMMMMSMAKRMPAELINRILDNFHQGRDRSHYGLLNAVTATARDTRDAEQRWRLEERGGAMAAMLPTRHPRPRSGAARRRAHGEALAEATA